MKKRYILTALIMVLAVPLCSCVSVKIPVNTPALSPLQTEPMPTPEVDTPPLPSVILTAAPATVEPEEEASGESCSYITAMSMCMDGQTDITFDFVDWLSGGEAEEKYLEDHPGATEEDMEADGLYEIGYIRNVNTKLRTFRTTPDTRYFLPNEMDMGINDEVSYDEFRDKMFPAVESGVDDYLTFVNVCYTGEEITKIEWLYLP